MEKFILKKNINNKFKDYISILNSNHKEISNYKKKKNYKKKIKQKNNKSEIICNKYNRYLENINKISVKNKINNKSVYIGNNKILYKKYLNEIKTTIKKPSLDLINKYKPISNNEFYKLYKNLKIKYKINKI